MGYSKSRMGPLVFLVPATTGFLLLLTHESELPVVFGRYSTDYTILLLLYALNLALLWRISVLQRISVLHVSYRHLIGQSSARVLLLFVIVVITIIVAVHFVRALSSGHRVILVLLIGLLAQAGLNLEDPVATLSHLSRIGIVIDRHHQLAFAFITALAVVAWTVYRWSTGIILEDALITYRYADNLASGRGFVFNPSERVLGTTTPLFTLALALSAKLTSTNYIPLLSNVLMFAAAVGMGFLTRSALLCFDVPRRLSLAVVTLLYFHPTFLWVVTGGMETPLVLLLMALGFYGVASVRPAVVSLSAGLLVMARPDGLVWACLIVGAMLVRQPRLVYRTLVPGGLLFIAWFLYATAYFGSVVPHTVAAKTVIGLAGPSGKPDWPASVRWVLDNVGFPFGGKVDFGHGQLGAAPFFVLLSALTISRGAHRRPLWILWIFAILFSTAMIAGGAPRLAWYLVPLTWSTTILAVIGLHEFHTITTHYAALLVNRAVALVISTSILLVVATSCAIAAERGWAYQRESQINETNLRRRVGEWLRLHTPPDASVATEAIGYQGYYSQRRIIDLAGLVSPAVVAYHRESNDNAATFRRVLEELQPDYIVLRSYEVDTNQHFHGGALFATEKLRNYFESHYKEAERFAAPTSVWGDLGRLTIYRRSHRT